MFERKYKQDSYPYKMLVISQRSIHLQLQFGIADNFT